MPGLEDVGGPRRPESIGRAEPEWRADHEVPLHNEVGEIQEVPPTNHLGYKDSACRDFRQMYEGEYIEPMSRTSPVERFADPHDTVRQINPEYDPQKAGSYETNCADCSRCFERTWRGHREEAAGRAETPDRYGNLAVRGEDDGRTGQWAGEPFSRVNDVDSFKARMEAAGHGSSAIVHSEWMTADGRSGGHAYNVVNYQGGLHVVDAQSHDVLRWDDETIHPGFDHARNHRAMMWDRDGNRM